MNIRNAGSQRDQGPRLAPTVLASIGLLLSAVSFMAHAEVALDEEIARLRAAVASVCQYSTAVTPRARLPDALESSTEPVVRNGRKIGQRFAFALREGDELRIDVLTAYQRRVRVNAEYRRRRGGTLGPSMLVIADGECAVRGARRLEFENERPVRLQLLAQDLHTELGGEPLDAPLPAPRRPRSTRGPFVRVAMVDSGVNYSLPEIESRLARDANGAMIGYDYWDLDARPFDASPSRSPYMPRRHGTKTASLMLAEAPVATLVPYRYPRTDMRRMVDLVRHAARNGVRVMNLSLGGGDREAWSGFEQAARDTPSILFVASAGNDGKNLDADPTYPAAFDLPNLISVTSSEAEGELAAGSSFGTRSVHVAVPAEDLPVTGFDGHARIGSGSSYAAARVSALAACLFAQTPSMTGAQAKGAMLSLAVQPGGARTTVAGYVPEPTASRRGNCEPQPRSAQIVETRVLDLASSPSGNPAFTHALSPTVVRLDDSEWSARSMRAALERAAGILSACGIALGQARLITVAAPRRMAYFRDDWSSRLAKLVGPRRPAVFFVKGTLQTEPFEAEAIGHANGRRRPTLIGTAWLTQALEHPGVALAHELVHLFTDTGTHDPDERNLMHGRTSPAGTVLREGQCMQMRDMGTRLGLLRELTSP